MNISNHDYKKQMIDLVEYNLLSERRYHYLRIIDNIEKRNDLIDNILDDREMPNNYCYEKARIETIEVKPKAVFSLAVSTFRHIVRLCRDSNKYSYKEEYLSPSSFIKMMEESEHSHDVNYKRNLKEKNKEIKVQKKIKDIRQVYKCIDSYVAVKNPKSWMPCPNCGLIPLVWEFNNGRSTACGCGKSAYDHFTIEAESILSHMKRNNGSTLNYDIYELKDNWNYWVKTGNKKFKKDLENNIW